MRQDISKIVFERGRTEGLAKPNKRLKSRGWPRKISCIRDTVYRCDSKEQRYNLTVIDNFLSKSIGKRWDDVWSEICDATKDSVGYKVRNLVLGRVSTKIPVKSKYRSGFYVEDGILKYNARNKYSTYTKESKLVRINNKTYFNHRDIWYEIFPKRIPSNIKLNYRVRITDAFKGCITLGNDTLLELLRFYGERIYSEWKRSACKREIKRIKTVI